MITSPSAIESPTYRSYLRGVPFTRLMRFLTILAVLLSPMAMVAGTPVQAMSHHAGMIAADAGHCEDMDRQSDDRPGSSIDCMMACAATIPELGAQVEARPLIPAAAGASAPVSFGHGLGPEAATPPPRIA